MCYLTITGKQIHQTRACSLLINCNLNTGHVWWCYHSTLLCADPSSISAWTILVLFLKQLLKSRTGLSILWLHALWDSIQQLNFYTALTSISVLAQAVNITHLINKCYLHSARHCSSWFASIHKHCLLTCLFPTTHSIRCQINFPET